MGQGFQQKLGQGLEQERRPRLIGSRVSFRDAVSETRDFTLSLPMCREGVLVDSDRPHHLFLAELEKAGTGVSSALCEVPSERAACRRHNPRTGISHCVLIRFEQGSRYGPICCRLNSEDWRGDEPVPRWVRIPTTTPSLGTLGRRPKALVAFRRSAQRARQFQ
jgi:hypothetical protein